MAEQETRVRECPRCGSDDPAKRNIYWIECMGEITCAHEFHGDHPCTCRRCTPPASLERKEPN